ncbi:unnamed protein product [Didymodactylos carnosus]|uniref:Uncharacterized protein n=1 Tax=Didymodactylos carnosus TaxID=1234261 RepID=A0A814ZB29_9BILA|nr:unnamed protein product [Didymodactylos carnosus]CAF4001644.1 unnamed protein product [Didymodactylos carnosus]
MTCGSEMPSVNKILTGTGWSPVKCGDWRPVDWPFFTNFDRQVNRPVDDSQPDRERAPDPIASLMWIVKMPAEHSFVESEKEKQRKRFRQTPTKNLLYKKRKLRQTFEPKQLTAADIKDHFTWALLSTILCFFIIGPCAALYYSRCIKKMIKNGEYINAYQISQTVSSLLMVSNIIGAMIGICELIRTTEMMKK